MSNKTDKQENRILGRMVAREISNEELKQVSGAASGGSGHSYSGPFLRGQIDDANPTDDF
ncbi:hypothetical protein [Pleionea litopenaei]|uniref:Uncharacterized protein n=1 Tax=Pleionea litopenaei TaxID=3070815 RepID=A0AA51RX77_9GAMM|nr:hypothetical protein [Pleionea sp. HL-JVS1]WMS89114.1 hypothetical protein Q9312_09445 [Pleionea sp. HL-JVS1]